MPIPIADPNKILNLMNDLVEIKSPTGSYGEDDILDFIESYVKRKSEGGIDVLSYGYEIEKNESFTEEKRSIALVKKGKSKKALLFVANVDTVGTSDYSYLEPVSTNPDKLLKSLSVEVKESAKAGQMDDRAPLSEIATKHAKTKDWIWGRGTLDMKGSLAALIETILAWENEDASLVLLICPDRHGDSEGIKNALPKLGQEIRKRKMSIVGMVGTDAWEPSAENSVRDVHMSLLGKALVCIYYRGPTGTISSNNGFPSALAIGSDIVNELDCAEYLIEEKDGAKTPKSLFLSARDLKDSYNTQVPGEFWGFMHIPTFKKPKEVLEVIKEKVAAVIEKKVLERSKKFGFDVVDVPMLDTLDLVEKPYIVPKGQNLRELCRDKFLASALYKKIKSPWCIVSMIPPYYPGYSWKTSKKSDFEKALDKALKKSAKKFEIEYEKQPFYKDVSELSLIPASRDYWIEFTPQQPLKLTSSKGVGVQDIPYVNIGPLGYGAASHEERVLKADILERVPFTLSALIKEFLS
ncbi:hypothetical protein CL643_01415 [bacterium]|nr:hypothetical protein [bacterium]